MVYFPGDYPFKEQDLKRGLAPPAIGAHTFSCGITLALLGITPHMSIKEALDIIGVTAAANGSLTYRGTWDANANNPPLASGVGHKGDYYVVSVSGNTNLDGITDWVVGDWAIFNGTVWEKADHTDSVTSVFGRQGAVVAALGDYLASLITNDSSWAGATVKDALNAILTHGSRHENGGPDQISVAGLTGLLATPQTPVAHAPTHKHGGSDEVATATPGANQIVKALASGLIADGWLSPKALFRCWDTAFGSSTAAGFNTGSQTPTIIRIKTFPGTNLFGAPTRACAIAQSSSGNPGYIDLYRPSNGTVILTIGPITALTPTVYNFTFPLTNPLPTTEEVLQIRGYRGPGAATMTFFDFTLGG